VLEQVGTLADRVTGNKLRLRMPLSKTQKK